MVNQTVACFLTCGYTEAGAMQGFLQKINPSFQYIQYLPNKTRKRKGQAKTITRELCGLTGTALLEEVIDIIRKDYIDKREWAAILYEDDADALYSTHTDAEIQAYIDHIIACIQSAVGRTIPVIVLLASPEIEGWFIADWNHGYHYLYTDASVLADVSQAARGCFSHSFHEFIKQAVLPHCVGGNIETFNCYFSGTYTKLSDVIITFFEPSFLTLFLSSSLQHSPELLSQLVSSRYLYYSKKLHGDYMLRNLDPTVLAERCTRFFAPAFYNLLNLDRLT